MEIENLGIGGAGGFIAGLLSYLGIKERMDRIEDKIDNKLVLKDACQTCQRDSHDRLDRIENKIDKLIERSLG